MSCELKTSYSLLDKISPVWKDFADGFLFESDLSSSNDCLKELIEFANEINSQSKSHSRKEVLNRISKRGYQFQSRLTGTGSDTTEILGLIGEIMAEDFLQKQGFTIFYIKWRNKGTAKSNGIDMIVLKNNENITDFFLIEAKHTHQISGNVSTGIKRRFEEGIGEFENEKTIYNLAGLSTEFAVAISKGRQFGQSVTTLEDKCKFLEKRMEENDYKICIITSIDKEKYNGTDFKKLMKSISASTDIGKVKYLNLTLLKIILLEEKTNLILGVI